MIGWLRALLLRYRDRHDPALSRYTFGVKPSRFTGYDEAAAVRGYYRSQRQTEAGTKLKGPAKPKPKPLAPVVAIRDRKASR